MAIEHPAVVEDMRRDAEEWKTCEWYHVGDRRIWAGYLIRCRRDHYAGDEATDPWDPGHGWTAKKRAGLWEVIIAKGEAA